MTIERRTVVADVETRAEGARRIITGYAAVFNERSNNLGGFVETVKPGAFTKTLNESDVRAYLNHDKNLILGRMSAGTLRIAEDATGLHYEIEASEASYAKDLLISLDRGDINQSSFAFSVVGPNGESWSYTDDNFPVRSLNEVRLFDVSPVVTPAYDGTTVSFSERSLAALCEARGIDPEQLATVGTDEAVRSILAGDVQPIVENSEDGNEARSTSLYRARLELIAKAA